MSRLEFTSFSGEETLIHRFNRIVSAYPERPALLFRGQTMNFRELSRQTYNLAARLQQAGIQPEDFVVLHMERSFELLVGIWSVLRAGGAYVPVDVNLPQDRLEMMIEDVQAKVILTTRSYAHLFKGSKAKVFILDKEMLSQNGIPLQPVNILPSHLAYCIFTSGSTGRPKGVLISHENLMNQLDGQQEIAPDPIQSCLLTCSISFDVSVLTIFWTHLQGAPLVLPEQNQEKDIPQLAALVEKHQVSHILTLPTLLTLILDQAPIAQLASLRLINVSGEVCSSSLVRKHQQLLPNCQLYNLYGPTEATVNCTYYTLPENFSEDRVPIGIPIKNYEIFILNKNLEPVAGDEVGEIYIGGSKPVVGKGYWNRVELTSKRFIPNPFDRGGETLYFTGDLARWLPDGNIEFLGRSDFQVKFKGYRIELGEIETAISNHPSVRETVVLLRTREGSDQQELVAYVACTQYTSLSVSELRTHLERTLPSYMLPTAVVFLDELPLTTNGKINRKILPDPARKRPVLAEAYEAPRGEIEKALTSQWEDILLIDGIGRNDKFFELGGDSVKASQFISQLQSKLQASIFITTIFDHPSITQYAQFLQQEYPAEINFLNTEIPTDLKSAASNPQLEARITHFSDINPYPLPITHQVNKKINRSPIFLLAPPRSGTSLLRLMFANHPSFFATSELHLLHFDLPEQMQQHYQGRFQLWQDGLLKTLMGQFDLSLDQARDQLFSWIDNRYTNQDIYAQLLEQVPQDYFFEKTPSYALDPNTLRRAEQWFEAPIYIHLVRHPYASITSFEKYRMNQVLYLHDNDWSARQIGEAVWQNSHQNIQDFLSTIPASRQFQLHYEDLVKQPEETLRALCTALNIPFHKNLLDPYQQINDHLATGIHTSSRSMSDANLFKKQRIDAKVAEQWKGIQKDDFLSKETKDIASNLGYPNSQLYLETPRHRKPETGNRGKVAIIAMSLRLPGAKTIDEFWQNLITEKDVSQLLSWEKAQSLGLTREQYDDPNYVKRVFSLEDYDQFDAPFFGYLPKEARLMDPQHRVFLTLAYEVLEQAGYNPWNYSGKIGVFGGVARNTYFSEHIATHPDLLQQSGEYSQFLGSETAFSISRIAYKLNLRGPAINVQTACSTSGVAIHLACQSLWNGESDMVLVGGGRIQPGINKGYLYKDGEPLSPDGYIRAFDHRAGGMARGNGMVMLLLKPLDQALEDKDHIWSVISASAINNDGSDKMGFTAPSARGQASAIEHALKQAGLSPEDISYIEAHGTGTRIGDPIELSGLNQAFANAPDQFKCPIGSVKTNIGHLDAGACVAGILKTALALKYGKLPATLHFEQANPNLDFTRSPFYVQQRTTDWNHSNGIRRAGISSFGLGGTNAHIILEEPPIHSTEETTQSPHQLLLLSAKTDLALQQQEQLILEQQASINIAAAAFTLASGRPSFDQASALILEKGQLIQKINLAPGQSIQHIAFMFPGGGAQYIGMGKALYDTYPTFQQWVNYGLQLLREQFDLDLSHLLFAKREDSQAALSLEQPSNALPALYVIEYAIAQLWFEWGIKPTHLVGHSMGEYTAACLAGVLSFEDGLKLVVKRGQLFESLPAEGKMLSVKASEASLKPYVSDQVSIAVINKPDQCVLSGAAAVIDQLAIQLEASNIEAKKIHIAVAAHSVMVEPILEEFEAFLAGIELKEPQIPFISNVTGTWADSKEVMTPTYWVNHLRQTVRFSDGLDVLFNLPNTLLLEVGPGQTLATFARQHPSRKAQPVLASLRHPKEKQADTAFLLKTVARLWEAGITLDWAKVFGTNQRIPLPTYPFETQSYWIEPAILENANTTSINQVEAPIPQASLPTTIETTSNVSRHSHLTTKIQLILQDLSGLEPEDIDPTASFLELGFDSLFLSQLVIQINNAFETQITFRQLFEEAATVDELAQMLDALLPEWKFQPTPATVQQPTSPTAENNPTAQNSLPVNLDFTGLINELTRVQQMLNGGASLPALPKPDARFSKPAKPSSAPQKPEPNTQPPDTQDLKSTVKGVTIKLNYHKKKAVNLNITPDQRKVLDAFIEEYTSRTAKSKIQAARHRKAYADPRSVTGFNKEWKEMVYQIAANRSKGIHFWDIDDNQYIDYVMSYGVALFGHSPDFVMEAVKQQLDQGTALDVLHTKATEVAEMLCQMSGMDRATLGLSGTDAVAGAVRAARTFNGKEKIAVFHTDYHGWIDQFMVRGVQTKKGVKSLPLAPGIPRYIAKETIVLNWDDPNVLSILEQHKQELSAILIEPIQAQNPHWQHPELILELREWTLKNNVALIFDEIINGFRLHQKGAQAWYGVKADLCAYGKSISGGLALSAVVGKEKYMDAFDGGNWNYGDDSSPDKAVTYFANTFIKNPIGVTAAHAALSRLLNGGAAIQHELNAKGYEFAQGVAEIFRRHEAPLMIQSTSSIFIIKPIDNHPLTKLFTYFLRMEGVNMRDRPCFVSTEHTSETFDKTYAAIERAIVRMKKGGLLQPYTGPDQNQIVQAPFNEASSSEVEEVEVNLPPSLNIKQLSQPLTIPLTDGQQEIWLNSQLAPDASAAYHIGTILQLTGVLDEDHLKACIQTLVQRHQSLRIQFDESGRQQTILPSVPIPLPIEDFSEESEAVQTELLKAIYFDETERNFDLSTGPLFRLRLLTLGKDKHQLLLTVHHAICDGWSLGILTRELGLLYANKEIPTPTKPFSEYALEQQTIQQTDAFKKAEQYWTAQFDSGIPVLQLPLDHSRPPVKTYNGNSIKIVFDAVEYQQLKKAAAKNRSTFYIYMMAAFQAYLHRISQQDDVVVGLAVAGHNQPGNQELVGHLIHMLPIRAQLGLEESFTEYLKQVRGKVLDAFDHQTYTFGSLMKAIKASRSADRNALISVAFNMDSPLEALEFGALSVETKAMPRHYETFDVFINLKPVGDEVWFEWNYNTDLFERSSIERHLATFRQFLLSLADTPEIPLRQLTLEDVQVQAFMQLEQATFPTHQLLHQFLETQAIDRPGQIALQFGNEQLTFSEWNEQANQVAYLLKKQGLKLGDYVGICLHRGLHNLIAIYGVLKAGGTYVPLDPRNPIQRLTDIVKDAGIQLLLVERETKNLWSETDVMPIDVRCTEIQEYPTENLALDFPSSQSAYVIYTSGSSGKPKGVAARHESVVQTLFAINRHLHIDSTDRIYSVSSMAFDMSIPDYFLPATQGARLILADEKAKKDGFQMKEEIRALRPTFMQATPTTWQLLLLANWEGDGALTVVSGGEALSKEVALPLVQHCKAVWNGYGPTETTIYATYKEVTPEYLDTLDDQQSVNIGRPLANVKAMILDGDLQILPVGIPGELYIGGPGAANGYLNRPSLNNKKFIHHPSTGTFLYRTGDRVRWPPNGDIEFLGRIDFQVKIRGYRIELGEIEEVIRQHPAIDQVAVLAKKRSGRDELVAYITTNSTIDTGALRAFLKDRLPGYMVPKIYMELEEMPMNTSLKVDRKALPEPIDSIKESQLEQATSDTEVHLLDLFQKVLGTAAVGVTDDFFDCGGHSLTAVDLMARIQKQTQKQLPLSALLQYPTARQLAQHIDAIDTQVQPKWKSLVPIREGKKGMTPLFLIHGGGLHVLFYQSMVKHLHPDQPVYALQAIGLDGKEEPLETVEEMAAFYISEIQQIQPSGPYHLAGYSLGGMIAYEMASQLIDQGKEIGVLALFDAVAKDGVVETDFAKKLRKTQHNLSLMLRNPVQTVRYKSQMLQLRLQQARGKQQLVYHDHQTGQMVEGASVNAPKLYAKGLEAYERYQMKPIEVKVHLLKANERVIYVRDKQTYGWSAFALKGVKVHEVYGNHYTMFDPPYAGELGLIMQQLLNGE